MNLKYPKGCPKCGCRELEELDCEYNYTDGIASLWACMDCDFKCTLYFGFIGWTSEDSDAESDEDI